jgi:hypothetical protein
LNNNHPVAVVDKEREKGVGNTTTTKRKSTILFSEQQMTRRRRNVLLKNLSSNPKGSEQTSE